jgi:glucose-1-phosphate thymidylyltransferase
MKRIGILLCGGVGSRLGQITKAIPKSLVPVYDKPLVDYQLQLFYDLGIGDVVIITRPDTRDLFVNYIHTYSSWSEKFNYIAIETQPNPGGIAEAYIIAEKYIPEGYSTLLGLGDNIFHFIDKKEKEELKHLCLTEDNFITTVKVKDPTQYGVVKYDENGFIIELLEFSNYPPKENWEGNLATTGLTHIALTVNDLRTLTVKLKENGYDSVSDIKNSPNGLVKVVFVKGPESLMLELVESM